MKKEKLSSIYGQMINTSDIHPDKVFHAKLTPRYWGRMVWLAKYLKKHSTK